MPDGADNLASTCLTIRTSRTGKALSAAMVISLPGSSRTPIALTGRIVVFLVAALTPKPEIEALEITADASKSSLIFSNVANVASQGAPVPIGYGRLKVGSQVVQATIKSFPQSQTPQQVLTRQSYIESSERGNWPFIGNKTNNYYD